VFVELWQPPPEPVIEAPKPPPVPKVEPKPEPAPVIKKPDIVVEKEKKAEPKKLDLDFSRQIREQAQKELETSQKEREREKALAQFKSPPSPARPSIDPGYANSIRTKIRSRIVLPPEIAGNPEAVFDVEQLPTGEVLSAKLRRSSGNRAYDD